MQRHTDNMKVWWGNPLEESHLPSFAPQKKNITHKYEQIFFFPPFFNQTSSWHRQPCPRSHKISFRIFLSSDSAGRPDCLHFPVGINTFMNLMIVWLWGKLFKKTNFFSDFIVGNPSNSPDAQIAQGRSKVTNLALVAICGCNHINHEISQQTES